MNTAIGVTACVGTMAVVSAFAWTRPTHSFETMPAISQQSCGDRPDAPWMKRQREWLDENGRTWTNDTLRTKLLAATGVDPKKIAPQAGVYLAGRDSIVRSEAIATIIADMRRGGRGGAAATRSAVGPAGVRAYFLLALSDSAYVNTAMHRMMEAGPDESLAADVAVLEDRNRLRVGRKQLYGTQFQLDGAGKAVLSPMEDSAHADLRREEAGLPPFATALCMARARAGRGGA